ncbi:BTB/POZ domain-containing protein 19 [Lingula anatina]|uniref:BTB/POZ domain-containing protein 19 n=1 Tax=Lingula anatina TaxID=7574 RepID=A0A1S3IIW2_LINAN|nr:BTB/POZ domain-containing protein 19 [Lingula anatina]|eukprot:XP_013397826.1 BTB/POZ domain-containing protein 19 [Lingula anatina]
MASDEVFMKGDIAVFAAEMKKLINNKETGDIRFLIGPNRKPIFAHRCILAARCDVFRAMFADQAQKNTTQDAEIPFVLSDITPDIFLALMEFLYTNCVTLNGKIAIDVLGSSIEYGLEELRKLCVEYLIDNLSVNNAAETMQASVTYGQDELRDKTMDYIEQNTENIFKTKGFHEMSEEAISYVMTSDKLDIDEVDVISAVREWATVNSVVIGKPITEVSKSVAQHIRLPLLSPDELTEVEKENKKDNLIPVECVSFAWKFHVFKKGEKGNALTTKRKGTKPRESHKGLDAL